MNNKHGVNMIQYAGFLVMMMLVITLSGCDIDGDTNSVSISETPSSVMDVYSSSTDIGESSSSSMNSVFVFNKPEWLTQDTTITTIPSSKYPEFPRIDSAFGVEWASTIDVFKGQCSRVGYITPSKFIEYPSSIIQKVSLGWCYIDSKKTLFFGSDSFGVLGSISFYFTPLGMDIALQPYEWFWDYDQTSIYDNADTAMVLSDEIDSLIIDIYSYDSPTSYYLSAPNVSMPSQTGESALFTMLKVSDVSNGNGGTTTTTEILEGWFMLYFSEHWMVYKNWIDSI